MRRCVGPPGVAVSSRNEHDAVGTPAPAAGGFCRDSGRARSRRPPNAGGRVVAPPARAVERGGAALGVVRRGLEHHGRDPAAARSGPRRRSTSGSRRAGRGERTSRSTSSRSRSRSVGARSRGRSRRSVTGSRPTILLRSRRSSGRTRRARFFYTLTPGRERIGRPSLGEIRWEVDGTGHGELEPTSFDALEPMEQRIVREVLESRRCGCPLCEAIRELEG